MSSLKEQSSIPMSGAVDGVGLKIISVMRNGSLRTLVGSLFTVIRNAMTHKLVTTVSMNLGQEENLIPPGLVDQEITETLHTILAASSVLPTVTGVSEYLAGVIEDAIGGIDLAQEN